MKWRVCLLVFGMLLAGCGVRPSSVEESGVPERREIVVGFSQLGAESDWRSANSESMRATFTAENGYKLLFEDGQQKQSNQITAIRTFIQREVDYIVLAPVTETGWDTVLQEAKDAGIPVVIVDRMVDVEDEDLFTCWVGSDFELEGRKAAAWLKRYTELMDISPEEIHIADIQGNLGASAQIGRTKGLERAARENGWDLVAEIPADFTQAKGREVTAELLEEHEEINVIYCENDNEALGALEAIEAAGRKAGGNLKEGEILIISFDGVRKEALQYALERKISCIAECNPLHGPRVRAILETLEAGKVPDKLSYVTEGIYSGDASITQISVDDVNYPVTILTEAYIK